MTTLNQTQIFDDYKYKVTDLIEASKDLEVYEVKVSNIFIDYQAPCSNTLLDFIEHYERVRDANLEYPIIMSPSNFILDGKHRVAKCIIEGIETIKAVKFKTMPDCGQYVED